MAPVLMFSLAEKPLSGEPDAGNPPVGFGGRGGANHAIPTPIARRHLRWEIQFRMSLRRFLQFFRQIIQAERDLLGLFAGRIWCEYEHAIGDVSIDTGRGEPAPFIELFIRRTGELAENRKMCARIAP